MKLLYRNLKKEELTRLEDINRSQLINKKYINVSGKLKEVDEEIIIDSWDQEELSLYIERLKDTYKNNGFIYGAFVNKDKLVGLISLDKRFIDELEEYIKLDLLYISEGYRHCGIGSSLVKKAIKEAKKTSAKYIYISSSEFKETVDFYMNLGGELVKPIEKMYKLEPNDIHLRIRI